jgi:hypothetical protein
VHIGPKGVSYVQVLPKRYSKSSVRLMVSRTSGVLFTERTSGVLFIERTFGVLFTERTSSGLPLYVRTTDRSVRSLDLAYVRPLWVSVKLLLLEIPNVIRLKPTVFGPRKTLSSKILVNGSF